MLRPISPQVLQPITWTSNTQGLDGEGNNIPTPDIIAAYEDGDLRKEVYFIYGPQFDINGNALIDVVTKQHVNIDPLLPAVYMTAENYTPAEIRTTGARVGKYEIKIGAKENSIFFEEIGGTAVEIFKSG